MSESEPVKIEVTIAAPIEQVWAAMRDPELIKRWHGWHMDGLDEEIQQIYLDADEDAANWTISAPGSDTMSLHQTADGVLVRITRPERGADPEWDAYYDDIVEGWTSFLTQLKFSVERHGLAERRTLFLAGELGGSLISTLGVPDVQPEQAYEARTATGDSLAGTVYARYKNQLILTVNGWGDGLLILGEQEAAPHHPRGGAMIIATMYNMDDATFQDLEARWTTWWDSVKLPDVEPEGQG